MPIKAPYISFLSIVSPVGIGLLVYIFFRGIPRLHINGVVSVTHSNNKLLSFCIYNLPDGLWLFALLQSLRCIWRTEVYTTGMPWVLFCVTGAPLSEYAQKLHIIPGTFDWRDIAAYIGAALFFLLSNTTTFINQHKFSV